MAKRQGRPKTFSKQHLLDTAIQAYWESDPQSMSINEICRRASVAKPGLYREFGNEDQFISTVIKHHYHTSLFPLFKKVSQQTPFSQGITELISFITSVEREGERHNGCVFVKMRNTRRVLGAEARETLASLEQHLIKTFQHWITAAAEKGEARADLPPYLLATYLDIQVSGALTQLGQGQSRITVKQCLTMALSVISLDPLGGDSTMAK